MSDPLVTAQVLVSVLFALVLGELAAGIGRMERTRVFLGRLFWFTFGASALLLTLAL